MELKAALSPHSYKTSLIPIGGCRVGKKSNGFGALCPHRPSPSARAERPRVGAAPANLPRTAPALTPPKPSLPAQHGHRSLFMEFFFSFPSLPARFLRSLFACILSEKAPLRWSSERRSGCPREFSVCQQTQVTCILEMSVIRGFQMLQSAGNLALCSDV